MQTLTLYRIFQSNQGTFGIIYGPCGRICYTLEPPWKDNRPNVSCIPDGGYEVRYMPRSASGKYKDCYHLQNVSGRYGILIHKGNLVTHTMGCILPGQRIGYLKGRRAVLGSASALRKIHSITDREGFKIHVRDDFIISG